jgi:hypothetical protein
VERASVIVLLAQPILSSAEEVEISNKSKPKRHKPPEDERHGPIRLSPGIVNIGRCDSTVSDPPVNNPDGRDKEAGDSRAASNESDEWNETSKPENPHRTRHIPEHTSIVAGLINLILKFSCGRGGFLINMY